MPNDLVFIWQCIPKSRSLKIETSLSEEYNCSFKDASIMFWSIPNTGVTARKSSHERAIIGTLKTKICLYLFYSCNSLWHFYKQTFHFHSFWSNFFLLFVRFEITILGLILARPHPTGNIGPPNVLIWLKRSYTPIYKPTPHFYKQTGRFYSFCSSFYF